MLQDVSGEVATSVIRLHDQTASEKMLTAQLSTVAVEGTAYTETSAVL